MKRLLLCLMILTVAASCGKDNKVSSGTGYGSSAITVNDPVGQSLGNLINSSETSFGNGRATYYESWNQYLARAPYTLYKYTTGIAAQNCVKKDGLFGIDYLSCKTSITGATTVETVAHNSVNLQAKRSELASYVNSAAPGSIRCDQYNYVCYITNASNGTRYTIDVKLPIQANPVEIIEYNTGRVRYFNGVN